MRDSLLWRLLGAQLLVIAIAVGISGALLTDLASHAFMMIMARYHIEPAMVEAEFLASTQRVLLEASLAAGAVATFLGWAAMRHLMRPLGRWSGWPSGSPRATMPAALISAAPTRSPGWPNRSIGWRTASSGSKRSGETSSPMSRMNFAHRSPRCWAIWRRCETAWRGPARRWWPPCMKKFSALRGWSMPCTS